MEFIQCPHCKKKYTVSDQLRASTGKRIRCKHCSEPFEIQIHQPADSVEPVPSQQAPEVAATNSNTSIPEHRDEASSEPEQKQHQEQSEQLASNKKKEKPSTKPVQKKFNTQILITISLVIILITSAVGTFLYFNKESLFTSSSKKSNKTIIPHEIIKPIDIKLSTASTEQLKKEIKKEPSKPEAVKTAPLPKKHITKTMTESIPSSSDGEYQSQVCKDISADYWIRSQTLATANMNTATYMKLLNQNLKQANEIRKRCKDKKLISKIAKAARTSHKPIWIKKEINSRLEASVQTQQAIENH